MIFHAYKRYFNLAIADVGDQFNHRPGGYGDMPMRPTYPNASSALRAMGPSAGQQFPPSSEGGAAGGMGFPGGPQYQGPRGHPSQYMDIRSQVRRC